MNNIVTASLLILLTINFASAEDANLLGTCDNANVLSGSLITDTPWNALYPIRVAGKRLSPNGSGTPVGATNKAFCACQDDLGVFVPGFTQSMFEPARIIELARTPDCMLTLNGTDLNMTNGRNRGTVGSNEQGMGEGASSAFWHYHYFSYPLLLMLEMVVANRCGDGFLDMDLLYVSELDPTWNDPELAFFANPESAIFANPISLAACITDAAAASVGQPIDSLYWCAGAWGGLYPLSGFVSNKSSIASKTSLLATRSVASLHRRMLARQTLGDDALCEAPIFPTIPKSQYKMHMMYPVPEREDAHQIGEPALKWGEWRNIPSKEDAIYMLWRYQDCCITYY